MCTCDTHRQRVTLQPVDLFGMNIMTLLPIYPSVPVKDPDNLLMARVVDRLIAEPINLGEKWPLLTSGSPL